MPCSEPCVCVCLQLKQIEVQLEEEYDDKQKVLRERRELEAKLLAAQDQVRPLATSSKLRKPCSYASCTLPAMRVHGGCGVGPLRLGCVCLIYG